MMNYIGLTDYQNDAYLTVDLTDHNNMRIYGHSQEGNFSIDNLSKDDLIKLANDILLALK